MINDKGHRRFWGYSERDIYSDGSEVFCLIEGSPPEDFINQPEHYNKPIQVIDIKALEAANAEILALKSCKKHFNGATYELNQSSMNGLIEQLDAAKDEIEGLEAENEAKKKAMAYYENTISSNALLIKKHHNKLENYNAEVGKLSAQLDTAALKEAVDARDYWQQRASRTKIEQFVFENATLTAQLVEMRDDVINRDNMVNELVGTQQAWVDKHDILRGELLRLQAYHSSEKTNNIWLTKKLAEVTAQLAEKVDHVHESVKQDYELTSIIEGIHADRMALSFENTKLADQVTYLRDVLQSIGEYWNGDFNDQAMSDMCIYATNYARETLARINNDK